MPLFRRDTRTIFARMLPAALPAWAFFTATLAAQTLDPTPPASPVRLVFIHHSVGWSWLNPDEGGLLTALRANNYYVSDTDYDWGPYDEDVDDSLNVGSHTDIGHWYNWFLGPHRDAYLAALYGNSMLSADWRDAETVTDPGGENTIVLFKSCFSSGQSISGEGTDDPLPAGTPNPLNGRGVAEDDGTVYTVANIKRLYLDLLTYFRTRPDKLFVIITTPPSYEGAADEAMPKLRAVNTWLVEHLTDDYPLRNVFVFDYSNVLTSNGGDPNTNDIGAQAGGHHRFANGSIEYRLGPTPFLAYATWDAEWSAWDNHPTAAGHRKATAEFVPLLNIVYNLWRRSTGVAGGGTVPTAVHIASCRPQPANRFLTLRYSAPGPGASVRVFDLLGRCVLESGAPAGVNAETVLDLAGLPPGVYRAALSSGASTASRAFVLGR